MLRRRDRAEEEAQFRSQRKLQTIMMLHFSQKVLPKARFSLILGGSGWGGVLRFFSPTFDFY